MITIHIINDSPAIYHFLLALVPITHYYNTTVHNNTKDIIDITQGHDA